MGAAGPESGRVAGTEDGAVGRGHPAGAAGRDGLGGDSEEFDDNKDAAPRRSEVDGDADAKQVAAVIQKYMPDLRERLQRGEDEEALLQEVVEVLGERRPDLLKAFSITQVQSRKWRGPLPSPDVLAQFEEIVPGCAARIIAMTEHVLTASGKTLDKVADAEITTSKRGQWMAYSLALISIGASIVFFALGNNAAGYVLLGLPVVLLITSFLTGGDPKIFRKVFGRGDDDEDNEKA
jgi:uncharacterized membrane protein